jgi:hypothetical protein
VTGVPATLVREDQFFSLFSLRAKLPFLESRPRESILLIQKELETASDSPVSMEIAS